MTLIFFVPCPDNGIWDISHTHFHGIFHKCIAMLMAEIDTFIFAYELFPYVSRGAVISGAQYDNGVRTEQVDGLRTDNMACLLLPSCTTAVV